MGASVTGTRILPQPTDRCGVGRNHVAAGNSGGVHAEGVRSLQYNTLEDHRQFRSLQRANLEERELNITHAIARNNAALPRTTLTTDHRQHYQMGNYTLSSRTCKKSRSLTPSFRPRSAALHARRTRKKKRNQAIDYLRSDPFSHVKFPMRTQLMMRREIRKKEERRLQELRKRMDYTGDERNALHPRYYTRVE